MQIQSTPPCHEAGPDISLLKKGHRKGTGRPKAAPERTCLVTRHTKSPDQMIRFVLSPDKHVVPDLKGNLPGRGVWVTATSALVAQAVSANVFARGFKCKATVETELPTMIDDALTALLLQAIALARKAGDVVTGFSKVDAALRGQELALLVTASDAARDGQEKLKRLARAIADPHLNQLEVANSQQLSMALGLEHVIHAGVMKGKSARAVQRASERLTRFRGPDDPCDQNGTDGLTATS